MALNYFVRQNQLKSEAFFTVETLARKEKTPNSLCSNRFNHHFTTDTNKDNLCILTKSCCFFRFLQLIGAQSTKLTLTSNSYSRPRQVENLRKSDREWREKQQIFKSIHFPPQSHKKRFIGTLPETFYFHESVTL